MPAFAALPPSASLTACGPDCAFAAPLPRLDSEWLWCHRPDAGSCVARVDHDCRHFCPRARPIAPPSIRSPASPAAF